MRKQNLKKLLTSINVRSNNLLFAQLIRFVIWYSLKFLKTTVFILTLILFLSASSMPSKTLSKLPKRVISLNFSLTIVSSDTLILLIHLSFVTAVHPSFNILTFQSPKLIIGSIVKNIPGFNFGPSPKFPK